MRKFSKGMLIAAAITGIVGIGMSIGGAAMGATITGLNLSKYGFRDAVRKVTKVTWVEDSNDWDQDWDEISILDASEDKGNSRVYVTDTVDELNLSISSGELFLKEYDGDQIKVEVSGDNKDKVRVGKDKKALVIEGIGMGQNRTVNVWYPKNKEFAETDITVGTGNIDLTMAGKKSDYNYEISCAAGNVEIGDNSYSGLGHEKEINNPGASGNMELECGVGSITVHFSDDSHLDSHEEKEVHDHE